jgi:hypothetical protein
MLMAAAGAGEIVDPRYDIANISYSGTTGPNYQSLAGRYAKAGEGANPINNSPLFYDMSIFNNGQGILAHGGGAGNVPSGYAQMDFAGANNYESTVFEMFDNYKVKFGLSGVGYGEATHWTDSTTLFTAIRSFSTPYVYTLKKFSLGTAWDISSLNTTPTQTVTLPASAFTADITSLKFNSTGTKFFIFTDNVNSGGVQLGGEVVEFNLTTAYDLTTLQNPNKSSNTTGYQCVHMNAAGDKIFYVNDLQDQNIRLRTLTTGFDLDTISGSETIYSMTALNTMSKGDFCGLAMNEADSNYSAGELVWIAAGWSVNSTVTRGVMSTPFDLSTVTWDPPLDTGAKIGLMPNDTGSEPVKFIGAGTSFMVSNSNDFKAGRYLAHYEKDGNNVWRKEAFSFNTSFSASSLTPYATTEVTNTNIPFGARGIQLTRGSALLFFSEENSGANQIVNLTYYSDNISNSNDPSVLTNPITRDVTAWAKDGFTNTLNVVPVAAQLRVNAEYDFDLRNDRRLWFLMEIGNPDAWYIRKMSSNSSQTQSNPNNWNLDTGTGNIWQLPFGAGGIGTDEIPTSLTVTPKGDKFLIMTGAGNLYLFNNDAPWDLDGTITLAQTATLPLKANTMPRNAWYNQDGTKLFVIDVTGFLYEYDCGT